MERFIARYRSLVTGVLSGFDRLVFRGSLLPLVRDGGRFLFLERAGVRLLDFKDFVVSTSERIKPAAYAEARGLGRPVRYLESSATNKEKLAEQLLAEQPVERGLICLLTVVEPCMSFEYHRSQNHAERGLKRRPKKCLHLYKYFIHPQFGFINARLQAWFPFNIQVCLNGREWLDRQLRRRSRLDSKRVDNCFTRLGNPELAQRLMNEQLTTDWPAALDAIARSLNPLHATIFEASPMDHYLQEEFGMKRLALLIFALSIPITTSAFADCANPGVNLLTNCGFPLDVAGWTPEGGPSALFLHDGVQGNSTPGSAHVSGDNSVGASQCFSVSPGL